MNGERFKQLTPEREEHLREYYTNLTTKMLSVGDSELRWGTYQDRKLISSARDSKDIDQSLSDLRTIIAGSGSHSLLSRTMAMIAYYDIASESSNWGQDFPGFFREVLATEREQGAVEVLSGAFYARLAADIVNEPSGQEKLEELDFSLLGAVDTQEKAARKLGMHVAANTIAQLIEEDQLRMRLPEIIIKKGESYDGYDYERSGGYPDKTMFLGVGRLPSYKKMEEAALWGMPDASQYFLNRRIQRLLVGVEVNEVSGAGGKGKIVVLPDKKLVHIYLRALRKPELSASYAFEDERRFNDGDVMENCSFDSLSFILAVRLSRSLEGRFNEIEDKDYTSMKGKLKEDEKRVAAQRATERVVERVSQPIGYLSNGEQVSVLSVALEESQRFDGTEEWGTEDAKSHLEHSVMALTLVNEEGALRVRREDEIVDLYKDHIWQKELFAEDKVQLALVLLKDPSHPANSYFWNNIPDSLQNEVALAAHGKGELSQRAQKALLIAMNKHRDAMIVLRCETIRDTYLPQELTPTS